MNRSFLLEASLCLCVVLSTAACGRRVDAASPAAEGDTGAHPATVEPDMDANNFKVDHPEQFPLAKAGEYVASPELNVTGVVSPDVSRQVPVPSLASGRVVEIDARLGDEVKQGQLLFKVRSTDIAGAFSDYQKAVKNEQLAQIQLNRAKLLFDNGAIPKSALEVAQTTEDNAKVDLETTTEHLRLLGSDPDHPTGIVEVCRPGFGSDYRSANHQLVGRAGSDGAEPLHDLRRIARLDCLRCLRKRSGPGSSWRVRGHSSECLSEPASARPDRQHRSNHGPEPSNSQGAPGGGESRPDALRDVRYRDLPRFDHGEARNRAGYGDPALARPRLGLYASEERKIPARRSGRWRHASREHAGNRFGRQAGRGSGSQMLWSCKTPWSNR